VRRYDLDPSRVDEVPEFVDAILNDGLIVDVDGGS